MVIIDYNSYYAGTLSDSRDNGTVYRTIDGGTNWEISLAPGTTAWDLEVDPNSSNTLYLAAGSNMFGDEGIFITIDNGYNWFPSNKGLTDRMARAVAGDPVNPNILYVSTDGLGGIYKSIDQAANWTQCHTGLKNTIIQSICFDVSNTMYAAVGWGTYRDIPCLFKRSENGFSWDTLAILPSPYYMTSVWDIIAHPTIPDLIYVGGASHYSDTVQEPSMGLLYKSENGGDSWEELWKPENFWIFCLAIDPYTGNIYAGTGSGDSSQIFKIYRSINGGDTWLETSGWENSGNSIFDIIIDPASPNILYAGTGGAVYKSSDYGANWIAQAIIPAAYSLLIHPDSSNVIYACSGGPFLDNGGIYKSDDYGTTWVNIGLEEYGVTSLICLPESPNIMVAGTGGRMLQNPGNGVFRSMNSGTSWEPMNTDLTATYILSIVTDPNTSGDIYAGTSGRGIFQCCQITDIEESEKNQRNKIPYLLSNYPNPFNASTHIRYQLPKPEKVSIKIFDIFGREVATLIETTQEPGFYSVTWDGRDNSQIPLPSGPYLIRIKASTFTKVQKCLLLK